DDPNSVSDSSVLVIMEDSRGSLWVGTENQGLNLFDRETETFIHIKRSEQNLYSLNSNAIYSLFESDNSMLWIGTYSGGVNILDRTEDLFEHYRYHPHIPTSLSDNVVTSFTETPDGTIWIGTDGGGLNIFDRETKTFSVMHHDHYNPQSIPSDVIMYLTNDGKESVWIATYRSGFSRFNYVTGEFEHYPHDSTDPSTPEHDEIFTLYTDPINEKILWVGTNGGGIYRYNLNDGSYINYRNDPLDPTSLDQQDIRAFHRDRHGTLRIGNYGGSIVEFNDETETFTMHYLQDGVFFTNVIQDIFESKNDELWLASWGSGLIRFDRDTGNFKTYTDRDGLPSNFVHSILEDEHGFLWLSSNNGISRFDPKTETVLNFGIEDGVQSREFFPGSSLLDSRGYMYFGGINGFNRFHPDSLSFEKRHFPVVFTDFLIYNESVPISTEDSPLDKHIRLTDKIVLSYQASVLTFNYASLNYDLNAETQYAYKLEGFENYWNYVGDRRSATYTNLRPGEYRLRVRTTDGDELVEDYEASIVLIITPPFWQTTWFYLTAGLYLFIVIGLFYWFRVYNIARQNKLLEEEVRKQTRTLHEKNQTLEKTLDELNRTKDQLVEKAHKAGMADIATNVLHDVGNILNSVNVSASVLNKTIDKSRLINLQNANALLREHISDIEDFVLNNPKGKVLLEYYLELDKPLANEYQTLKDQIKRLTDKINLIIDVVSAQQSFSTAKRIVERLSIDQIIDDTLSLRSNSFSRHEITIEREYQAVEPVNVEKIKLIHVLINVLKNAVDAIKIQEPEDRRVKIKLYQDDTHVFIAISDTGNGFDQGQLSLLFKHGYTTKEKGMGFGLHSCANYMKEMKGDITANSEGIGKGAEFILSLPR
ncbi:two-component regulator propeller domain-containing protein, partial [Balneolaceae bacterium ANBcel3]|nr:two-component regulator propeller domain-containing protein [Balneolaceae bacterium ANBcel3]